MLVPALLVGRAVSVDDTLRSARHVRISKVLWDASAGASISLTAAHSIVAAGSWVAGVNGLCPWRICRLGVACREGVSHVAGVTLAYGIMVAD